MISIGSPIPIKLKVASEIMAVLTFITIMNIIDEKKFGIRCFHIMRKNPAPIHLAAMIYSLFRICRTSVRITFAILVQLVTPITIERLTTFAFPIIACNKMIRRRDGKLNIICGYRFAILPLRIFHHMECISVSCIIEFPAYC